MWLRNYRLCLSCEMMAVIVRKLAINPTCLFSMLWFHTLLKALILFVLSCP